MRMHRLLWVLPAALLLAQGPPSDPPMAPKHDELKQAIGLTDDQVQKLMDLRHQERDALRSVHQQMRDKGKTLHAALDSSSPDPAALGTLLLEMKSLRGQVRETNDNYRQQALGLLNGEQKAKLKQLEDAAKLAPAIHQGVGLNLLAPPGGSRGFGWGGFGHGPDEMFGEGPGPGGGPGGGPGMRMGRRPGRRL